MFDWNTFIKDVGLPILTIVISTVLAWFLNRRKDVKETVKIERETESVVVGNAKSLVEIWSNLYEEVKTRNDACMKDLTAEREKNARYISAFEYLAHAVNDKHPELVYNARRILE